MTESDVKRFEELLPKHGTKECTPEVFGELLGLSIRIIGKKVLDDLLETRERLDTLERRIDSLVDKEGGKRIAEEYNPDPETHN